MQCGKTKLEISRHRPPNPGGPEVQFGLVEALGGAETLPRQHPTLDQQPELDLRGPTAAGVSGRSRLPIEQTTPLGLGPLP